MHQQISGSCAEVYLLTVLARQSPQLADFSQTSLMISYFLLIVLISCIFQRELISCEPLETQKPCDLFRGVAWSIRPHPHEAIQGAGGWGGDGGR